MQNARKRKAPVANEKDDVVPEEIKAVASTTASSSSVAPMSISTGAAAAAPTDTSTAQTGGRKKRGKKRNAPAAAETNYKLVGRIDEEMKTQLYSVQFNTLDPRHSDLFATCGGRRVSDLTLCVFVSFRHSIDLGAHIMLDYLYTFRPRCIAVIATASWNRCKRGWKKMYTDHADVVCDRIPAHRSLYFCRRTRCCTHAHGPSTTRRERRCW